jgi:hypothetical protein
VRGTLRSYLRLRSSQGFVRDECIRWQFRLAVNLCSKRHAYAAVEFPKTSSAGQGFFARALCAATQQFLKNGA